MGRLSDGEIVRGLERHGLRHRSVAMVTEGEYLPDDVDWNNKDILHRNHVHSLIDDLSFVVDEGLQAVLSYQRVLGLRLPIVLVHYDSGSGSQTHVVTFGAWTMVTRHDFVLISSTRTRATTTYTVAGSRVAMLAFPLIRTLLGINYRRLMSEDIPMRERRGELRRWGYTFAGDGRPRDIRDSLDVMANNVLTPGQLPVIDEVSVPVAELRTTGWRCFGRSDQRGLRIGVVDDKVVVYPMMCTHDGADLSAIDPDHGQLVCPWHGRAWPPLAALDPAGDCEVSTDWHLIRVSDGIVDVVFRDVGSHTDPGKVADGPR